MNAVRSLKLLLKNLRETSETKISNENIKEIQSFLSKSISIPQPITHECCSTYNELNEAGKQNYLSFIASKMGYLKEINQINNLNIVELKRLSTPLYSNFINTIMHEKGGVPFLIEMRTDLQKSIKQDKDMRLLYDFIGEKLKLCFSHSFLKFQQIDWSTSASILENVKKFEAVHKIDKIEDIKPRTEKNRRIFGFFHDSMPNIPLCFISVALTESLSSTMSEIFNTSQSKLRNPNCAVFYSITSTLKGLSGIDLGSNLIKDVVSTLQNEFPSISTFSTLSPIPSFKSWIIRNWDYSCSESKEQLGKETFKPTMEMRSFLLRKCEEYY